MKCTSRFSRHRVATLALVLAATAMTCPPGCATEAADSAAEQPKQNEKGFLSIFDGKTLNGWEATPVGTDDAWEVVDGAIVGTGKKARGYLNYAGNKNIADLEMKFSYRFPGKGNSGVSIRAIPDPTRKRNFQSYHADLGQLGIGKQVLGAWDFHSTLR